MEGLRFNPQDHTKEEREAKSESAGEVVEERERDPYSTVRGL